MITTHSNTTKLVVGLVGVALALTLAFAVPSTAKAQTIEDLTAQINSLLVTIQALQAQLATLSGGGGGGGTTACSFTRDLTLEVSGSDVTCLQNYLTGTGHFTFSGGSTGYFGPITRSAVAAWQAANNVSPPAGYFGPISKAKYSAIAGTTGGGGTTLPPATGTGLSVGGAVQPAASLAPDNASRVPFTNFTVTAGSDGAVVMDSVTVQRTGLSSNLVLAGIVLLGEDGTQYGLAKTLNSDNKAKVGAPVTIPAGTTMRFTIAGNMDDDNSTRDGQIVSLSVVGINTSAIVSGILPITGASHTVNSSLTIGTVTAAKGGLDPNTNANKEVGTTDYTFAAIKLTVGSAEDVRLKSIRWNQSSSVASSDIENVKIVVDGVEYPTVISTDGKYYSTVFGSGIVIAEGLSKDISIKGDIVSGSNRGVDFDLYQDTDVYITGETFGYGITPTIGSNNDSDSSSDDSEFNDGTGDGGTPPWYDGREVTVGTGSLTVSSTNDVPAGNIADGANSVSLGSFKFDVRGESISFTQIAFTVGTSTGGSGDGGELLTNIILIDGNGSVLAGPQDPNAAGDTVTLTDTITLPVGENIIFVKGNLNNDWENDDTIVFSFDPSSNITSITGSVSGQTITATPAATVTGKTQTVQAASLIITPDSSFVLQNIINNSNGQVIGRYVLDASSSGEDVRITTAQFVGTTGANADVDDYNTIQLFDGSTALNTGSNTVNPSGNVDGADVTLTMTLDSPGFTVPKGTSKVVELRANVNDAAVGGTPTVRFDFEGLTSTWTVTGVNTGTDVVETLSATDSAVLTVVDSGSVTATVASADPVEKWYVAGSVATIGVINLTGTNEAQALTDLSLMLDTAAASSADIQNVSLWNELGAMLVEKLSPFVSSNSEAFDLPSVGSSSFIIPKDDNQDLTVKVKFALIGTSKSGTSGNLVKVATTTVAADNKVLGTDSGTASNILGSMGTTTGARYFRSLPTLAKLSVPLTDLANGTQELYRFSVTADSADDIAIFKFSFTVATTASNADAFTLTEQHSGKVLSTSVESLAGVVEMPVVNGSYGSTFITVPAGQTYTYLLKAVVTNAGDSGDSVRIYLNGDEALSAQVMDDTTAQDGDGEDDFIWSPISTGSVLVADEDWANGYKVPGIETDNLGTEVVSN